MGQVDGGRDSEKENRKLMHAFLLEESRKGHTEQGFAGLKRRIPKFFEYLQEMDLQVQEVGVKEAQGYQRWLIETGRKDGGKYAGGTIRNYLKAAGRFYRFLKSHNLVHSNPFIHIRQIRYARPLPKNVLKEGEMNRLLKELARYDSQEGLYRKIRHYKVHVIAELQYSTGLRISEAASIRPEDIDFERGRISVVGKGRVRRVVFLNEYAKKLLQLYLTRMKDLVLGSYVRKNRGLFGANGSRLTVIVSEVLDQITGKLGYPHLTSHGFRHALGFHLLRAGCDMRYIQAILGHERLKTTEIYTKVDKEDLRRLLDEYHPRKWRKAEA